MMNCGTGSGACVPAGSHAEHGGPTHADPASRTVHYAGDPMCSWCWGMAPALKALADRCVQHAIGFSVTVGGLRPGGGDAWSPGFRGFLRREWEHVQRVTGQPFGFTLLDRASFNYDTEPACRAVVVMANLLTGREQRGLELLAFFSSIQRRFYVEGADPGDVEFYRDICPPAGVTYEAFRVEFSSERSAEMTIQQFERCRRWGVRAFPSVLLDDSRTISLLASGYMDSDSMLALLDTRMGGPASLSG